MSHKNFFKLLFLFILGGFFQNCSTSDKKSEPKSEQILNPELNFQPNILWIVVEDMSPYLPFYGDSTIEVPNLERLASEGVVYDHFLTPHPVCAPARAAIATGMYANHIAASHMRTRGSGSQTSYEAMPPAQVKMFSEYLRMDGYYTTNRAKEDYQFNKTPTAWDESSGKAHWRNREDGQKFFSIFNLTVTHESRIWAKANDSLWVSNNLEVPVPPYLPNTEVGLKDIRRMYSNIKEMDARVGEILDELEEDGLMDSTVIFWYSDHGGPLPRQKRLLHESGVKVPLIVRFPNKLFAGERDNRITSFVDLAPTVLSLVGIEPKDYMEGGAFLGKHIRKEEPKYAFGAADRFDEMTDRIRSARDKKFKYIRYYMPEKPMYLDVNYRKQMPIMQELLRLRDEGKLTEKQALWFRDTKPKEELFDIVNDPHEVNDLAKDPKYKEKLAELRQACENWANSGKDTGMIPESELLDQLWPTGEQPVTANPVIQVDGNKRTVACETEGASIGYKIMEEDSVLSESWKVYTGPISLKENQTIKAVAHRIGYKRSEVIEESD